MSCGEPSVLTSIRTRQRAWDDGGVVFDLRATDVNNAHYSIPNNAAKQQASSVAVSRCRKD
jgi:hypothetical protein